MKMYVLDTDETVFLTSEDSKFIFLAFFLHFYLLCNTYQKIHCKLNHSH
jgi:hypothetical protein